MTADQAVKYINDHTWSSTRLGLDRTRTLLNRLHDPQKQLKFVHVAGTNGKGSTCAMIGSILKEAGYRVGLYPSPYIEDFNERIQVNGDMISDEDLAELTGIVAAEADQMEDHPSQFEIITAIGMLYFLKKRCDIVVLEVGMGGRLDSTNVIDPPLTAVITNIGLDHMEYLGDTVEKIAAEKAGIIKPGCDVIVYDNQESVMEVIKEACVRNRAVLRETKGLVKPLNHSLKGQRFIYKDGRGEESTYELSLLGSHQLNNAAVALKTIEALKEKGFCISGEAICEGLKNVRWPARFELLGVDPVFILDGGHNPQCAGALAEGIRDYIPEGRVTFIIGMLADKDYRHTIDIIKPFGANYVCLTPDSPRALPAKELESEILKMNAAEEGVCVMTAENAGNVVAAATAEEAIEKAEGFGLPVVAFGSLYMAGGIRRAYRKLKMI